jgi:hypothetical protein
VPSENTDKLLLDIFKSNTLIYPVLKNQVIEALLDKVSAKVDKAENEMKIILHGTYQNSMISAGVTLGKRLIKETKKTLKEIEVLLGKSDPIYIEAMDKVFSQVNFHGILPFNMLIQKINESESNFYLLLKCDLSMVISLYNSAIRNLSGLDLPIKETLKNNKKGVGETNSQITIIKARQASQKRRVRQQYNSSDNGQCFIATAALGSYDHSQVIELRHFRDQWILTKNWGAGFVKWYYHYGAIAAKVIEKSFTLRKLSYLFIVKPLVFLSRIVKNK